MSVSQEGTGPYHHRTPSPLEAEIDGYREAIRLNWVDMETLELTHVERQAIRANVSRLVHLLAALNLQARSSAIASL